MILLTYETVTLEVARHYCHRMAESLRIPAEWVTIRFEPKGATGMVPVVDIKQPVLPGEPEAPSIHETLKQVGIVDVGKVIDPLVNIMMSELRIRFAGLADG